MKNFIERMKDVLKKQTTFQEFGDKHFGLALIESKNEGEETKLGRVEIIGFEERTTVSFKLDDEKLGKVTKYLKASVKDIHKQCDDIIVTQYGDKLLVIISEMKSQREDGLKNKLINSWAFFNYVKEVVLSVYGLPYQEIDYAFVIFKRRPGKNSNINSLSIHNRPPIAGTNIKVLEIESNRATLRIGATEIMKEIKKSSEVTFS